MKRLLVAMSMMAGFVFSPGAWALEAFACEPEWGALLQELGGDRVSIYTATGALQDPHQIQAKPSLLAKARRANLVVCTGAELEIGWLPVVLRQSGNDDVQPGKPGYFEAAHYVRMLEVPTRLDRADGDIHPGGNPHIQTDPRNIALVATALARRLGEIDPANAAYYQGRYRNFAARWDAAIQHWQQEAAPLRGVAIVVHHKAFAYLENWLGLHEVAQLEPKPGVEPTGAHLAEVLAQLRRQPAKMVVRTAYNDERPSQWLAERAKIPEVMLPFTVGGTPKANDLFGLFDDTVQRLLSAAR
jgi:zinc/manganese transport system substrate-binding protein